MKTILYTILLFKLVHSQCHLRSIQSCLQDEQCQLIKHQCQNRPNKCEDIDATNPNNCNGIQCYYDFEFKICKPYQDQLNNKSRRNLDHDDKSYDESESQHHHDNNQQNQSKQQPQDNPSNNQTIITNDNQPIPPETESNTSIISNTTESDNQSTNSTDVLTFEMAQFNFNQDEILNSNLNEKDLVINTSSSIILIATVILSKLFI